MKSQRPPAQADLPPIISGVNVSSAIYALLALKFCPGISSLSILATKLLSVSINFWGLPIKDRATFHGSWVSNFLDFLLIGTFGSIPARICNTHVNV